MQTSCALELMILWVLLIASVRPVLQMLQLIVLFTCWFATSYRQQEAPGDSLMKSTGTEDGDFLKTHISQVLHS